MILQNLTRIVLLLAIACILPFRVHATASVLQENMSLANTSGTSVTSNALGTNATVGSLIEAWLMYYDSSGTLTPTSVTDSAGQTYTFQKKISYESYDLALYTFADNQSASTLTVTADFAASNAFLLAGIREIGGVTASPIQTGTGAPVGQAQPNPGGAANAISSGSLTPTAEPCLLSVVSFYFPVGNPPSTAGTGFTLGSYGWPFDSINTTTTESERLTTLTTTAGTFTNSEGGPTGNFLTIAVLYTEAVFTPSIVTSGGHPLISNGSPVIN